MKALKLFNSSLPRTARAIAAAWLVPRMRGVSGGGKCFKFLTS